MIAIYCHCIPLTHDGAFTSHTVLDDSSTYDSVTHSLVVPSVSDQHVITDPTSYTSIRNHSTQYPTDKLSITVPNTYSIIYLYCDCMSNKYN